MASTLRFDNWEDSNGTPILDGSNLAIPSSAMPAGSILQVVSTTKTDTFTMSSTTFSDVTGLAATITPSSTSSKILVSVVLSCSGTTNQSSVMGRLLRGSTPIAVGDAAGSQILASFGAAASVGTDLVTTQGVDNLDSPSTTDATTYKIQVRSSASGQYVFVNRSQTDSSAPGYARTVSTITLTEVAG